MLHNKNNIKRGAHTDKYIGRVPLLPNIPEK